MHGASFTGQASDKACHQASVPYVCLPFVLSAALSNSHGDFILNGDFVVSMFKREIKVGNAAIEYSGSDNAVERINSTDRIEQEIVLQVADACLFPGGP